MIIGFKWSKSSKDAKDSNLFEKIINIGKYSGNYIRLASGSPAGKSKANQI
jgi:hypothetical protein